MSELVLLEERFDDPALPGWAEEVGAYTFFGPKSRWAVEDGALVLRVARRDTRFLDLARTVPIGEAKWIRVQVRMRTEGVDPEHARFDECDLFVRFGDGPIQVPRQLEGTQPWTPISAYYPVPAGATSVTVGLFLSMPGLAAFDDVIVTAVDPPWTEVAEGHYVYHWLPGDDVPPRARAWNEARYLENAEYLGVPTDTIIPFWKYRDRDTKQMYTGIAANGHSDGSSVYSIWSTDDHESTHVLARGWGWSTPLLAEGLAVFRSGNWGGEPLREYARDLVTAGTWIPLPTLLLARDFRAADDMRTYPIAGAFADWVDATYGKDALKALYTTIPFEAGRGRQEAVFRRLLGKSSAEADEALRAWLTGLP